MKVTIRPAVTADRSLIEAASRTTWDEHVAQHPPAFPANGWDLTLKRDHEFAFWSGTGQPVGESGNLFVAEAADHIVGFILLSWHLRADTPDAPDGTIIDIWVHPDWRKKGVARNLVQFAKEMADQANWDNLIAQVWGATPTSTLFDAAGFEVQHTTWRYGPNRAATLMQPRSRKKKQGDIGWKWTVAIIAIAIFLVIASQL